MSQTKHLMDEVAARMGIQDPNDPRVQAEVERLLATTDRRLVVLGTHPNRGGCWIGKMGTTREVMDYLKDMAGKNQLDYVGSIIELKEGAEHETMDWLELEDCQPVRVIIRPPGQKGGATPPLPGIERRLAGIKVNAYGHESDALRILQGMTNEEITEAMELLFSENLQHTGSGQT